jgi:hypothetical protein
VSLFLEQLRCRPRWDEIRQFIVVLGSPTDCLTLSFKISGGNSVLRPLLNNQLFGDPTPSKSVIFDLEVILWLDQQQDSSQIAQGQGSFGL